MSEPRQSPIFITLMRDGKYRVECHKCGAWHDVETQVKALAYQDIHGRNCSPKGARLR